jgi:tetratricopeptide (TPR) repeat protein
LLGVLCAICGLAGLGAAGFWWAFRSDDRPPPHSDRSGTDDPRATYRTPYLNVRPEVKYVGDAVCAKCHRRETDSFRRHPMARPLTPVARGPAIERYDQKASNPFVAADPYVGSGLHYRVTRQDGHVFHEQWAGDDQQHVLARSEAEVQFAIGSGRRARTYLVNHDGYLFESPITWYSQGRRWDLSPSYETRNQHFSRAITPGCLFCHSNQAEHALGTANRFREPVFKSFAIGCERCHGPGELHVKLQQGAKTGGGKDYTIVNPPDLEHSLREAVCHQCHLQSEQRVLPRGRAYFDYRPGLPLYLFMMDFVTPGKHDAAKFVGEVDQLLASRCYRDSREPKKLGCISCHNPHHFPAAEEKASYYRGRCLECHKDKPCPLPRERRYANGLQDSCIACHMPRTGSEVSHTSITDHRIRRRPEKAAKAAPHETIPPDLTELVPFHRELVDMNKEGVSRNRGLALMAMLERGPPEEVARQFARKALPLLESALARDPHDVPAWEARGTALWMLGRLPEALSAYEKGLVEKPDYETTLHAAGKLALQMNRRHEGRRYLERAIRVNPWRWQYYHLLAVDSWKNGEWEEAVELLQQSLRLQPFNSTSRRQQLASCYWRLGQKDEARAEFQRLLRLVPAERRAALRQWFEQNLGALP